MHSPPVHTRTGLPPLLRYQYTAAGWRIQSPVLVGNPRSTDARVDRAVCASPCADAACGQDSGRKKERPGKGALLHGGAIRLQTVSLMG
jgi:hypothetical protein